MTSVGFEPTRPCEHQPLKLASLPFLHEADDFLNKKSRTICSTFCDPTGARTQDPIIKSDVLYQLSYRVFAFKKKIVTTKSFCDPTGARTQDPIIKSDVLYQLSYRVIIVFERGCKYKKLLLNFQSNFVLNLSFFKKYS